MRNLIEKPTSQTHKKDAEVLVRCMKVGLIMQKNCTSYRDESPRNRPKVQVVVREGSKGTRLDICGIW